MRIKAIFFFIIISLSSFAQSCDCDSVDLERLNIYVFDELYERGYIGRSGDTIFLKIGSYYHDSFDIPMEIKLEDNTYRKVEYKAGVPYLHLRGCDSFNDVLHIDIDLIGLYTKYLIGMSFLCLDGDYSETVQLSVSIATIVKIAINC